MSTENASPQPDHHRSDHAPGRPRQDRHLPQRRGNGGSGLLPGARAARLREVRRRPPRGGHAADHLAHLRRLPDGAPHGRHQGRGRGLLGGTGRGREEDPRAGLQHLHGRGPRAALLLPGRTGFRGRPDGARRRAQRARRDREGRGSKRARRSSPCGASCARWWRWRRASRAIPCSACRAESPAASTKDEQAQFQQVAAEAVEFAAVHAGRVRQDRPAELRLRGPDPLGHLHPPHALHGDGGRAQPGQLLRRAAPRGHARRQGSRQVRPAEVRRLHRRARGAVELHEVLLPEAAGVEGLHRRRRERRLQRGAAGPLERRRRHGHAAGAGGLREVHERAGREDRAPDAGQPLGPPGRDDVRGRAHAGTGQRPRDHQRRHPHASDRSAEGRRGGGRGSPRHAVPPLRDRREAAWSARRT